MSVFLFAVFLDFKHDIFGDDGPVLFRFPFPLHIGHSCRSSGDLQGLKNFLAQIWRTFFGRNAATLCFVRSCGILVAGEGLEPPASGL